MGLAEGYTFWIYGSSVLSSIVGSWWSHRRKFCLGPWGAVPGWANGSVVNGVLHPVCFCWLITCGEVCRGSRMRVHSRPSWSCPVTQRGAHKFTSSKRVSGWTCSKRVQGNSLEAEMCPVSNESHRCLGKCSWWGSVSVMESGERDIATPSHHPGHGGGLGGRRSWAG